MGQHLNVYNEYDWVQVHGGKIGNGGIADRKFKDAENVEVKLPWWRRNNDFGISNHSIMHSNIDTWKKYIEPKLKLN